MAKKTEYVLMQKGNEKLAVVPSAIDAHELQGWNVVGICEVDVDGVVIETGKVIGTPAHTIVDSGGYLRVIPVQAAALPPAVGPVIKVKPLVKVKPAAKVPAAKVEPVVKPADKPK